MSLLFWVLALACGASAALPALDELRRLAPAAVRELAWAPPQMRAWACVFDGRTGEPASSEVALRRAASSQIVYAGERHDDAAHHQFQAELLGRLMAAHGAAGAGFEMLYASQQAILDRYLAGALSGGEFQEAVNWKKTWGFPFSLYEPIFERLRGGGRRGAALNISKSIVHQVAVGGLSSLSPEQRREVPEDFQAVTDAPYLAMLRETFAHHGDPNDAAAFARYVDAMSLWNEAMASGLTQALRQNIMAPIMVAAGAFHAYNAGIPASVARRRPGVAQTSFILETSMDCPARLPPERLALEADYVWILPPRQH